MFDLLFHNTIKNIVYPINCNLQILSTSCCYYTPLTTAKLTHFDKKTKIFLTQSRNIKNALKNYTTSYIKYFKK